MNQQYLLEAVTPVFSYGINQTEPEIRPASIRGQLHWWHRALGGSYQDECAIFGTVAKKKAHASRVIVRVSEIAEHIGKRDTLPHKNGGSAAPKRCYTEGTCFRLDLLSRLGLDERQEDLLRKAAQAWLLLGGFGTRATRGGGSLQILQPDPVTTLPQWQERVSSLIDQTPLRAAALGQTYNNETEARKVITDTLGGPFRKQEDNDLMRLKYPLGKISGGRKTSPLRLRVYRFEDGYRIIAVWDGRQAVTGNRPEHLTGLVDLLERKHKPLGLALRGVLPQLTS